MEILHTRHSQVALLDPAPIFNWDCWLFIVKHNKTDNITDDKLLLNISVNLQFQMWNYKTVMSTFGANFLDTTDKQVKTSVSVICHPRYWKVIK